MKGCMQCSLTGECFYGWLKLPGWMQADIMVCSLSSQCSTQIWPLCLSTGIVELRCCCWISLGFHSTFSKIHKLSMALILLDQVIKGWIHLHSFLTWPWAYALCSTQGHLRQGPNCDLNKGTYIIVNTCRIIKQMCIRKTLNVKFSKWRTIRASATSNLHI